MKKPVQNENAPPNESFAKLISRIIYKTQNGRIIALFR